MYNELGTINSAVMARYNVRASIPLEVGGFFDMEQAFG